MLRLGKAEATGGEIYACLTNCFPLLLFLPSLRSLKCQLHFLGVEDCGAFFWGVVSSFCFTPQKGNYGQLLSAGITEIFFGGGEGARKDEVQRALPARPGAAWDFVSGHVRFVGPVAFPAPVAAGGGEGVPSLYLCGYRGPSLGRAAARLRGARRALAHAAPELCGRVSPPQLFLDRGLPGRAGY